MKGISIIGCLAVVLFCASIGISRAQTSTNTVIGVVAQEEGLPLLSPDEIPSSGTFWQILPGVKGATAVPWPTPPPFDESIYSIADGQFLVDDATNEASTMSSDAITNEATPILNLIDMEQSAQANLSIRRMGMDDLLPPGGTNDDEETNSYEGLSSPVPDYGTNLWIANVNISSNFLSGIASNTLTDVIYEIQSRSNLLQTNWDSKGFFAGSESTNWTQLNPLAVSPTNNAFFRIRSWADSSGSGIPDWWWIQYFGQATNVDPYADPMGDGYDNLQKFQNGMDPTQFYTPPAPQGLTAVYNTSSGTANVSWVPSPGPVTGYTAKDSDGRTFTFAASTTSFTDDISADAPDPWNYGTIDTTFQVQANYGSTNSSWSASVSVESDTIIGYILPGPLGNACLVVSALPPNTTAIRLQAIDDSFIPPVILTNFDIPIGNFTNGLCQLANNVVTNFGESSGYLWFGQAVGTNGHGLTATAYLGANYTSLQDDEENQWLVPPFFDGRVQLKQNLVFQLRSAVTSRPFQFTQLYINGATYDSTFFTAPTNYAYAGYIFFYSYNNGINWEYEPFMDTFLPFEENYIDRNFVLDASLLDSNGRTTTGIGGAFYSDGSGGLTMTTSNPYVDPWEFPGLAYDFTAPTTNGVAIPSLLATNVTRWLATFPPDSSTYAYLEIGVTNEYAANPPISEMLNPAYNWFGLQYASVQIESSASTHTTLYPGNNTTHSGYLYPETLQPKFSLVGYDTWVAPSVYSSAFTNGTDFPGMAGLSMAHTNPLLITAVGNASFQISCYAQLMVTNSIYTGVYGFLQQYFDEAYQIDSSSTITTNTTGVLSPYGQFFATQPGPVALVTMPDIDTGQRGTNIVHCISLNVDKNHDGVIDQSFSGPDATLAGSPDQMWINNNFDRYEFDASDGTNYMDDLSTLGVSRLPADQQVPDCNYVNSLGERAIPCTRDLEDYARLWAGGISPSLLAALPTGSTLSLQFSNCVGNPTIDLFAAADPSIAYQTNETVAKQQIDLSQCPYLGRASPTSGITFTKDTWPTNQFIWCGVGTGSGALNLTISDGNGNVLGQTTVWLSLRDIKQMYERWTVGDNPHAGPINSAVLASDYLPTGAGSFQYDLPADTNTAYILFVHGWNMRQDEKDRFAECAFKRLYWQGYAGRFGEFRWPTGNSFGGIGSGSLNTPLNNPENFDGSESNSWASATGLLNKLNDLNAAYPGHVYLMAHSMGNVAAGEALRLAGSNTVVNTYVSMQGAVSAHCYDPTTPSRWTIGVPDFYANYWTTNAPCYFNGVAGAETFVNFFNLHDFALDAWTFDQDLKPDVGYGYVPSGNFFTRGLAPIVSLYFPTNTYELFSFAAPARSYALGAQDGVGGVFDGSQVNLQSIWPPDPLTSNPSDEYSSHFWHSAQFRGDYPLQGNFWKTIMGPDAFNLR